MNLKKLPFPLIIGLVSAQKINFIGDLYIGEVMAVVYVIFNIARLQLTKVERSIVIFALIWACAQFVSDIFNKTELTDAIKGIFAPLVFVTTFIFLINYIRNEPQRLPLLLLGFILGGLIHLLIFPTTYFLFNPWKWGLGSSFFGLYIVYFSFFKENKNNFTLFSILMLFFAVSIYYDGRSMAVFPLVSALIYIKFHTNKVSGFSAQISGKFSGLKILLMVLPVLYVVNTAASAFFSSPVVLSNFSSASAAKYRAQATGAYGILLGGRSEILVSGQAFLDKPLLGHGSWAKDKSGYLDAYSILRYQLGYSLREDGQYEDFESELLIPVHSYLMGAFVWAGIFGGLFWIVVLNNVIKIFIRNLNVLPLYFYVGIIGFVWSVFFSPFGASGRWGSAVFLATLFSYSNWLKSKARITV